MMFTIANIYPGDWVKWEYEGHEYSGTVTQILARTLLCAVTAENKKEWVLRIDEIVDHKHKTQEVHL